MAASILRNTILLALLLLLVVGAGAFRHSTGGARAPLRYIYLTFDDGPLDGSENIDSVILAERLKISVFLVGAHALESRKLKSYYSLYEQNPFVESYNHSFTHAHDKYKNFYSNAQNVLADILKNEQELNLRFKIVRLPGRNIWRLGDRRKDDGSSGAAAADLLAQNGFRLYGWDIEWEHDPRTGRPIQSVPEMAKEIVQRLEHGRTFTKDHIVVLVHDEMFQQPWERSELNALIDTLRQRENYLFEHIRYYPDQEPGQ